LCIIYQYFCFTFEIVWFCLCKVLDTHHLNAGSSAILISHCILCKFIRIRHLQILELYPTCQLIIPHHEQLATIPVS
jgi:hypothetical protein